MIQMNNVRMVYKNTKTVALDKVNLTIDEGEFVFLVGLSGSGKTTLMKLITGELHATSGSVSVNGYDMMKIKRRKLPKMRRTLGVVFQDYRLIENMNVYDNVAFAMRVVGASRREIKKRVPYVLELVGLEGREKRLVNELSGGEQQRVAIARALVNSPRMLVADEPTGNLDPVRSFDLMRLFDKINEMGTTVLVVTHEKELVDAFSKRVITIDQGQIVSDIVGGYSGVVSPEHEEETEDEAETETETETEKEAQVIVSEQPEAALDIDSIYEQLEIGGFSEV